MLVILKAESLEAVHTHTHTHTHTSNIIRKITCCTEHFMFGHSKEIFLVTSESFNKLSYVIRHILKLHKGRLGISEN